MIWRIYIYIFFFCKVLHNLRIVCNLPLRGKLDFNKASVLIITWHCQSDRRMGQDRHIALKHTVILVFTVLLKESLILLSVHAAIKVLLAMWVTPNYN